MKKYYTILSVFIFILTVYTLGMSSCTVSQKVQNKTGTQLWGENCGRCHNAPSPGEFSSANWDMIGMHMRVRAQITKNEEQKIIEYLKGAVN